MSRYWCRCGYSTDDPTEFVKHVAYGCTYSVDSERRTIVSAIESGIEFVDAIDFIKRNMSLLDKVFESQSIFKYVPRENIEYWIKLGGYSPVVGIGRCAFSLVPIFALDARRYIVYTLTRNGITPIGKRIDASRSYIYIEFDVRELMQHGIRIYPVIYYDGRVVREIAKSVGLPALYMYVDPRFMYETEVFTLSFVPLSLAKKVYVSSPRSDQYTDMFTKLAKLIGIDVVQVTELPLDIGVANLLHAIIAAIEYSFPERDESAAVVRNLLHRYNTGIVRWCQKFGVPIYRYYEGVPATETILT